MFLVSNPRSLKLLAVALLFFLFAAVDDETATGAQSKVTPARATDGAELFRQSCASSYCHGEQGKGGGAPPLSEGTTDGERVTQVIVAGIPGTAMPAFGDRFTAAELEKLTTYILSLASAAAGSEASRTTASTPPEPVATGASTGETESSVTSSASSRGSEFAAGRELFFGAGEVGNCRVCHSFGGKGGEIGPDLTAIGSKSESEILESIISPSARITRGYESIVVSLRDGRRITGVKRDETAERLRIYDTSSLPPVSRSIQKSDVASVETTGVSAMPSGFGARLTDAQMRDLAKFLRQKND